MAEKVAMTLQQAGKTRLEMTVELKAKTADELVRALALAVSEALETDATRAGDTGEPDPVAV